MKPSRTEHALLVLAIIFALLFAVALFERVAAWWTQEPILWAASAGVGRSILEERDVPPAPFIPPDVMSVEAGAFHEPPERSSSARIAQFLPAFVIPSCLPGSDRVRPVECGEELRQRHAEGTRQAINDIECGRLLTALQIADVRPVQPSPVSHGRDAFVHRLVDSTAFCAS